MPNVVIDASTLVGALLKENSVPERALRRARAHHIVCLSSAIESEIRGVFARPKFQKYLLPGRIERILDLLTAAALIMEPSVAVTDCRDAKDNKYLELALAVQAEMIIASDEDLLVLNPWRGIPIVKPAEYLERFEAEPSS